MDTQDAFYNGKEGVRMVIDACIGWRSRSKHGSTSSSIVYMQLIPGRAPNAIVVQRLRIHSACKCSI